MSSQTTAFLRMLGPLNASPDTRALAFVLAVGGAVLLWSLVGLGPYSGFATPPQFGDFEAQRHWMELTQYLPTSEWYFHDFDWWRLDYPPLTAYHSWLCGVLGSKLNREWFLLYSSRGLEGEGIKAFMRVTVILSQLAVYVPAVWYWVSGANLSSGDQKLQAFFTLLVFPALTIIDHGHFQYNAVMLGLATASFAALRSRKLVLASILFMAALFFKQMALYYAPVIFTAILGCCLGPKTKWRLDFKLLAAVGITVLLTAFVLVLPFIDFNSIKQPGLLQIVVRVFPVFRGLWEDKVANLWCTLNYTIFKLHNRFTPSQLQLLALVATLLSIAPSCVAAFVGRKEVWPWAFASCAWGFFLFSFQVHEKSVLIPLMPSLLISTTSKNRDVRAMALWVSNVAYCSLWPLLKREGLGLQFFTTLAFANWILYSWKTVVPKNWLNKLVVAGTYAALLALFATDLGKLLPTEIAQRYPDLLVVLNMAVSFASFGYFWLWTNLRMVKSVLKN